MDHDEPVDSRDLLLRLMRRWPWLLTAIIAGGLLGLGAAALYPPVYEAVAVVGVGIDYGRTLPLDDEALRHAFDRTREVFLADEVLETVWGSEAQGDQPVSANVVRESLRLSEIGGGWELGVRTGSAEAAARMANAWASASIEALGSAAGHAWRAAELQSKWYITGCELQPPEGPSMPAAWACAAAPDEYDPEQAQGAIEEEAVLSRGILPSMSFSMLQEAEPPGDPLAGSRGMSILAGLLAGAVVGVMVALIWRRGRTP
jgi:uncharacterized protein involved in exopolysaccharide biosynthesis